MFRLPTLLTCVLLASPFSVFSGHLPTVLAPFSISPSVEIFQSPVSKVETISYTPTVTKAFSTGGAAVAVAAAPAVSTVPVVQRIESYSSGDSSNSEIRDLLRSLLSELRSSKSVTSYSSPKSSYGPPSDSYGAPPPPPPSDSYGAPPRNTYTNPSAPSYPDSGESGFRTQKPEKVVVVQERQPAALLTAPAVAAVAQVQTAPVAVKELVRTVYQPVYVPVEYAAPQEYVTVAQPVTQQVLSAVPTRINTGSSAIAISQIHSSPALAIQQQQLAVPVVENYQQVATLSSDTSTVYVDASSSSGGGYQK